MAGVRHKTAADLLRGLEPVGQLVELLSHLGHLVPPLDLKPVAVLPFAHNADGPQEGGDPGGKHLGEKCGHDQGGRGDDQ